MDFSDEESPYMEVNYSFLLPHADDRLKIFQKANQMHTALWEIYNDAHAMADAKVEENSDLADFAGRIAQLAIEVMDI